MSTLSFKPVLAGLPLKDLDGILGTYPPFRIRQIYTWISSGIISFEKMTNLPLAMRKELKEKYTICAGEVIKDLRDSDGTIKLGIKLKDGEIIETVMLRDGEDRKTACLSTQAGCPLGCAFCKTGSIGFKRNLSAAEISSQFIHLKNIEKDITHIVIMGMGEPLLNLDELRKSLDYFMLKDGINISKRRITISTSGIVKGIEDLTINGPDLRLALSLTTARTELREKLMPQTVENPLQCIKKALLAYQQKWDRRITLEMVLLGGINTGLEDVKATADFAEGLNTIVNLIPWNTVEGQIFAGIPIKAPSSKEIIEFKNALEKAGLNVTRRYGKGLRIQGACGQLGAENA